MLTSANLDDLNAEALTAHAREFFGRRQSAAGCTKVIAQEKDVEYKNSLRPWGAAGVLGLRTILTIGIIYN